MFDLLKQALVYRCGVVSNKHAKFQWYNSWLSLWNIYICFNVQKRISYLFHRLEEYCIAEYESEWYRGKVVEILDEDKFLVAYIDFTNECELTSASIRRYPMSLNIPCCTNLCAIEGN